MTESRAKYEVPKRTGVWQASVSILTRLFGRRPAPLPDHMAYDESSGVVSVKPAALVDQVRKRTLPPAALRGRVSRSSNLANGITSAVIHFGMDEPAAKQALAQDVLVEVRIIGKAQA